MTQMVRYDGSEKAWKDFQIDFFLGLIFGASPFFAESGVKGIGTIGNILEHELVTIFMTFQFMLSNDGFEIF